MNVLKKILATLGILVAVGLLMVGSYYTGRSRGVTETETRYRASVDELGRALELARSRNNELIGGISEAVRGVEESVLSLGEITSIGERYRVLIGAARKTVDGLKKIYIGTGSTEPAPLGP